MLIKGAVVVNEGKTQALDVRIEKGKITSLQPDITQEDGEEVVMAQGKYLLPGLIDDQVHFREPGLTHKACIRTCDGLSSSHPRLKRGLEYWCRLE